jgi:hypothetical protein
LISIGWVLIHLNNEDQLLLDKKKYCLDTQL